MVVFDSYKDAVFDAWDYDTLNPTLLAMVSDGLSRFDGLQAKVLDVGCATGAMGRKMKSDYNVHMVGIEFFPSAARQARNHYDSVYEIDLESIVRNEIAFEDIWNEPPFDFILLGDVLEHLTYPDNLLEKIKMVLKPDGRLYVSLPNVAFLPIRLRLLFGDFASAANGLFKGTANGILHKDHLKFYTIQSAKDLLETTGFDVMKVKSNNGTPFVRLLGRLWPTLFAFQMVMDCKPKNHKIR